MDHFISTSYTVLFGVNWWYFTAHDGQRIANSEAQQSILDDARKAGVGSGLDPTQARIAAEEKWAEEKGFSFFVLLASWFLKVGTKRYMTMRLISFFPLSLNTTPLQIFFMICLYSFAMHLRRGTYRSLPASKPGVAATATAPSQSSPFRRRGSQFGYSHLRNTSTASEYELPQNNSSAEDDGNGLDDVLQPRTPTSINIPKTQVQPPSPIEVPSAGPAYGYPASTSRPGAASPALMRSRSTGGEDQ